MAPMWFRFPTDVLPQCCARNGTIRLRVDSTLITSVKLFRDQSSHQCGDLRHLSKCSAHFLQHCFREKFLFGDSTVGTPGRQPTMPEVPPTGTRSAGYSDIQNSVVQIVRNSEHTSFSVKVRRPVRNKSLLSAIQVTTSHI